MLTGRTAALGVAVLALGSIAADSPGGTNGTFVGVLTGLMLLSLVGYAFYEYLRPVLDEDRSSLPGIFLLLVLFAAIKLVMLTVFSGFGVDVGDYQAWADQMWTGGPAHMYQPGFFIDYPPGYLYALWFAAAFAHMVGATGDFFRLIIESPAIIADFVLAILMYAFIRRGSRGETKVFGFSAAIVAMLMVAINPALLYDTVVWGQTDSVMSFVMVLSIGLILIGQYELGWGMAAIGVMVKPQALIILPVIGVWTMFETEFKMWLRSGVALLAVFMLGIGPFQFGHEWDWIFKLYASTAAYYHETSVNAFNLMALIGGVRAQDSETLGGFSYYAIGMSMLVPLYAFIAWILMRGRTPTRLMYASFLAIFGFFMIAPRMHERYLYPAIVLAVPLAFEAPEMLILFVLLSINFWVNLADVLRILTAGVFLDRHDGLAMVISSLNLVALTIAIHFGIKGLETDEESGVAIGTVFKKLTVARPAEAPAIVEEPVMTPAPAWSRIDTLIISALLIFSGWFRYYRLWDPPEIVFDETHFMNMAKKYLHGEYFLDPHPPLAKLVIAIGIWIFGDHPEHPWSWRIANATVGTALVGITYLLGRKITGSRLVGAIAGGIMALDGMFIVYSRNAVIDITYVTCAAVAYLLFFRFVQTPEAKSRRNLLIGIGVALGLCVGAKLYIPAITFLLVTSFLAYVIVYGTDAKNGPLPWNSPRVIGAAAIVGGVAGFMYLATFFPHYYWGWWGGIQDLFTYLFHEVPDYEKSVTAPTHPYSSPWWSWPLMLRPVAFWQKFPEKGDVRTIWGGGNPLLWWGALSAMTITAVQAVERPNLTRWFLVSGYIGYIVIWIPIARTTFLYHYLPALYLAELALAMVLANFIQERAEPWEHIAVLLTLIPACLLGMSLTWGIIWCVLIAAGYIYCLLATQYPGRYTAAVYVAGAVILFFYFLPIWMGWPISHDGYYARMWLQTGYSVRNWI
ncbi:MAG TPA: phospholipid carrier-dependent glycosyltransferase [Candidatus Binataceae bacterium]|nr:phospholipid carrier-dependent glycosyltransferase [Candidatus Binataceae bacterium]